MSDLVMPVTPRMAYSVIKTPGWKTILHQAGSGKETAAAQWSAPLWEFEFPYYAITDEEMLVLSGFFNYVQGAFKSFYFKDPTQRVTDFDLGTGDGTETEFQLYRQDREQWFTEFPAFPPPCGYGRYYGRAVWATPYIYLDGVLQYTGYEVSQTGLVTFDAAPGAGVAITADFDMYYKVRLKEDNLPGEYFLYRRWKTDGLTLVTRK